MKVETKKVEIKGSVKDGKVTLDKETLNAISGGGADSRGSSEAVGVSPRDGFVAQNAPFIEAV